MNEQNKQESFASSSEAWDLGELALDFVSAIIEIIFSS